MTCILGLLGAKMQYLATHPGEHRSFLTPVWSSDRRLGVRRVPVQLLESSLAGVVGALALAAVILFGASAGGLVFVAGFAAYTAGRQVFLPLRGIPRSTTHGPMVMLGSASLVALAATAALLLR